MSTVTTLLPFINGSLQDCVAKSEPNEVITFDSSLEDAEIDLPGIIYCNHGLTIEFRSGIKLALPSQVTLFVLDTCAIQNGDKIRIKGLDLTEVDLSNIEYLVGEV